MEPEIFEPKTLGAYIAGSLLLLLAIILKYGKEIFAFFKKSPEPFNLLEEVRSMKKTIQEQSEHISRIEKILEEFQLIIEVIRNLRDHPSRKFLESITISLGFTDSLRPDEQDKLRDFLIQFERAIRLIPISGKKLSLNFLETQSMNSQAITAVSNFFANVSIEDVIRLKVLFPEGRFDKLARNLNALRSTTGTNNVSVVSIKEGK
ncbi:MAG: hypothetical protein GW938_15515 [Leptospira sp.]|nr:hypothetical protein [Leptospira sp.]